MQVKKSSLLQGNKLLFFRTQTVLCSCLRAMQSHNFCAYSAQK
jgi:hypothetical protein